MKSRRFSMSSFRHALVTGALAVLAGPSSLMAAETQQFTIAAGAAPQTLNDFGRQSGLQMLFDFNALQGVTTRAVTGEMEVGEALGRMLEGTGQEYRFLNEQTVVIRGKGARQTAHELAGSQAMRLAQAEGGSMALVGDASHDTGMGEEDKASGTDNTATVEEEEEDPERGGIPEILVTGSKVLNMDIRRTEDDIQPYRVFEREEIERSGSLNLEDFFKNRLTTSASANSRSQTMSTRGSTSSINLRSLGSDETLILIDGRRVAGLSGNSFGVNGPGQPDLNGIPLASIERIEVLSATASGIYGGGATGGVINVVRRRDYSGIETKLTYGNTFGSDAATRRVELSGGLGFGNGHTNVLFSGSYADSNPLLADERDLIQRGRRHLLSHHPDFFYAGFSPPLGYTTNICSATAFNPNSPASGGFCNGTPLTLDDGTALDESITYVPVGYRGALSDGGAALVANAGQYNLDLPDTAQNSGRRSALINNPALKVAMITLRHSFTPQVLAFVELDESSNRGNFLTNFVSMNPVISANVPANPFQQAVLVSVPTVGADAHVVSENQSLRAAAGLTATLSDNWQAGLDFTWHRSRFSFIAPESATSSLIANVSNGTIDVLRDLNVFPASFQPLGPSGSIPRADTILKDAALRLGGSLPIALPAGSIVLSTLLERRDELYDDSLYFGPAGNFLAPHRSQVVSSGYLEAKIPLVSKQNAIPGIYSLELQLALRRDVYEVNGSTDMVNIDEPTAVNRFTTEQASTDPTVGFRYQPHGDITLRASYGTGYLPPSVNQLAPERPIGQVFVGGFLFDPLRGNEPLEFITLLSGGNPGLRAEESESWSAGLIFMPQRMAGFRASADWTRIHKRDNITTVTYGDQAAFDAERFVSGLIIRAPRADDDPFSVGPVTAINTGLFNIAQLRVDAVDLSVDYHWTTRRAGDFDLSALATRMIKLDTQLTDAAPVVRNLGVTNAFGDESGGLKWKVNSALTWRYQGLTLGWTARFFDSYFLNVAHTADPLQDSATIPSQTYHDVFGRYRFANGGRTLGSSILSGTEITFGINNIFDKAPPLDIGAFNTGFYSPWGDPRSSNYYLAVYKSFGAR